MTKFPIPDPPGKPQPLSITENSVRIQWQKPEKNVQYITSYSVLCMQPGHTETSTVVSQLHHEEAEITGLMSNTQYACIQG